MSKTHAQLDPTFAVLSSNAEHTCNTLRYADRVKELSHGHIRYVYDVH